MLHNFKLDGFDSLYPRYAGGRPPIFTLAQRREIKRLALSRPVDHDLPFSTWSLAGSRWTWSLTAWLPASLGRSC